MKNMKTKKRLIAIIVSLCFLVCSIFVVNNGTSSAYAWTSDNDGIYGFQPAIATFTYGLDEEFLISFMIDSETYEISESTVTSLNYTTNGFLVIQSPFYSQGFVKAQIKYNGTTVAPIFTVIAELANGHQLCASIYGIIEDNALYINGNSYEGARDIYYATALEKKTMTSEEYEAIFSEGGGFSEITNKTSLIVPFSSDNTWVSGTLQWIDDWGNTHPLQHTKVTVYDQEGGWLFGWWDSNLSTVYTNANGGFSVGFSNRSGGRNIFIRVWPEGENSVVKTGANNEYVWRSDTTWEVATGSTTTINRTFNMRDTGNFFNDVEGDGNLGRAFQISQATIVAARYITAMRGSSISDVTVRYPHNESNTGCFYRGNTVYIIGNRDTTLDTTFVGGVRFRSYASWDVIMHEYLHHAQNKLSITNNPGGRHTLTGNLADMRGSKSEGIRLAYAESWPNIVGTMAQQYYIDLGQLNNNIPTIGAPSYTSYNGASINYNTTTVRTGEATEASIMGAMWDMYASGTKATYNQLGLGHTGFWNVTVEGNPKTFSDMVNRYYAIYTSAANRAAFGAILTHWRMAPESINNTGTLVSHAPPTFNWTANGTSSTLQNNSFTIEVYSVNHASMISKTATTATVTLTQSEWDIVMAWSGSSFFVSIIGSQTSSPSTGGYGSVFQEFNKPQIKTVLVSGTLNVTGYYSWIPSNLTIEPNYNGIAITAIGNSAFLGCTQLSQISIPASATSIGSNVFENCTNLASVTLSNNLISIGNAAFKGCSNLNSITIPNSVTSINPNAFENCTNLASVTLPNNLISIGSEAFKGCTNLNNLIIPSSVVSISSNAFDNCTSLNNIVREFKYNINVANCYYFIKENLNNELIKVDGNTIVATSVIVPLYFNIGEHIIEIKTDNISSAIDTPIFEATSQLLLNSNQDIRSSIQNKKNVFYFNNHATRFVTFTLEASSSGTINYSANSIVVRDLNGVIQKFTIDGISNEAKNVNGSNTVTVYLPDIKKYYVEVNFDVTAEISELKLTARLLDNPSQVNLFDLDEDVKSSIDLFNNTTSKGDEIKAINILQSGKFEFKTDSTDQTANPIFVIMKKEVVNNQTVIEFFDAWEMDDYTKEVYLESGIYYVGYFNIVVGTNITIQIFRLVNQSGSHVLVTDPDVWTPSGSQISIIEADKSIKSYRQTFITEGFTRLIYPDFNYGVSASRLDYDWYSSNTNVATVTPYGTVLALPVTTDTTVKIMAVLKVNPSKVFVKEFTVLNDTETYSSAPIDIFVETTISASQHIYASSFFAGITVPIVILQYYSWSSSNTSYASVDGWGIIYAYQSAVGETVVITGNYLYNSRVKITMLFLITY